MKTDLQMLTRIFLVIAVVSSQMMLVASSQHEKQLYEQLLRGYNRMVRPVKHSSSAVKVTVRFSLVDVIGVDETNGHVSVKAWTGMTWNDEYLKWNPEFHGGIRRLNFLTDGSNRIWTPDIMVLNAFKTELDTNVQAVVTADGLVTWIQPAVYTVRCRHEFRGNSWISAFKLGSWTYNEQMVDLQPPSSNSEEVTIDLENYSPNDQWALLERGGRRDVKAPQGCCDQQSFVSMYYILKLRKKLGPSLLG